MKRNRFTDAQIVAALRDAEATTVVAAARWKAKRKRRQAHLEKHGVQGFLQR